MKKLFSFVLLALICGLTLVGCSTTPKKYDIAVYINGANFGRVSDDVNGTYEEGQSVTISATPYENQTFFCWLHDNQVVSIESTYTFKVDEKASGSYIALFSCLDLEYICLDNFAFENGVTLGGEDDVEIVLKNFTLSIGHSQNELVDVYSSIEYGDEVGISVDSTILYEENQFPFAFDKTSSIYVKVLVAYERAGIEYISETITTIPATNVGTEHTNVESLALNEALCTLNPNIPALEGSDGSSISINFKKLSDFEFKIEEPEEE